MKNFNVLLWVVLFSIAFAFVEASVVVYLREIYHPEGFSFPLKTLAAHHGVVEIFREFSTIVILVAVGFLAGTTRWQKTAWFLIAFGIWDIFYYVWLKAILGWPASLFDWDILFLIPVPWIGPVIAPLLISFMLVLAGALILQRERSGGFRAPLSSWAFAGAGTVAVLYSFMRDTQAGFGPAEPEPFSYGVFASGIAFYLIGMFFAFRTVTQKE
ncbi:MAG: hypothetical protein HYW57_09865 [Ignavibacteriales bacterium]|nr:hypothetical protein [Ignavibacteriales bacterium]